MVERERAPDELDGLRWYTDFEQCDAVLWERYFHCADLGKDLVPVVQAFKASAECASGVPSATSVEPHPPLVQDVETSPPAPFALARWLEQHAAPLARGESLELFPGVPSDLHVRVCGGAAHEAHAASPYETWLHQLVGSATCYQTHTPDGAGPATLEQSLPEGSCGVVPAGVPYSIRRDPGSIGLVVARVALPGERRASETAPGA